MRKMLMTVVLGLAGCVGQAPTVEDLQPAEDLCSWRNDCDTPAMVQACGEVYATLSGTSSVSPCALLVEEAVACDRSMDRCPFAAPAFRNPCYAPRVAAWRCIQAEDAGM